MLVFVSNPAFSKTNPWDCYKIINVNISNLHDGLVLNGASLCKTRPNGKKIPVIKNDPITFCLRPKVCHSDDAIWGATWREEIRHSPPTECIKTLPTCGTFATSTIAWFQNINNITPCFCSGDGYRFLNTGPIFWVFGASHFPPKTAGTPHSEVPL